MEHALQLELAHAGFETVRVLLDLGRSGFVVFAFGELEELGRVGDGFGRAVELLQLSGEPGAFAAELSRLVRVLPDRGVLELAGYLFEAFLLGVVLKETP
jgi:hypothetical protein